MVNPKRIEKLLSPPDSTKDNTSWVAMAKHPDSGPLTAGPSGTGDAVRIIVRNPFFPMVITYQWDGWLDAAAATTNPAAGPAADRRQVYIARLKTTTGDSSGGPYLLSQLSRFQLTDEAKAAFKAEYASNITIAIGTDGPYDLPSFYYVQLPENPS